MQFYPTPQITHQDVFVKSCLYKRWEMIQDKVQDREQDRISFRQIQMFLPKWYFKRAIDSGKVMSDGDEDGEKLNVTQKYSWSDTFE